MSNVSDHDEQDITEHEEEMTPEGEMRWLQSELARRDFTLGDDGTLDTVIADSRGREIHFSGRAEAAAWLGLDEEIED